jgi:hypothetical protein
MSLGMKKNKNKLEIMEENEVRCEDIVKMERASKRAIYKKGE